MSVTTACSSGFWAVLLVAGAFGSAGAGETLNRDWLVRLVTRPLKDTPRNRRYLEMIRSRTVSIDLSWFQRTETVEFGYGSRRQTNALGRLAFCYHTPGTRHYKDPQTLATLRAAYRAVAEHVNDEGRFTWEKNMNSYGYDGEAHEHAWRVEPLLLGCIWAGEEFPPEERRAIESALHRAADWLARHPLTQTNNRGAVWAAVLTMCSVYFDNDSWRRVVDEHADAILRGVVLDDGEVGEHTRQYGGGGPCTNYSYTGWSYVYLYRVMSGREDLDAKLTKALRWFAAWNTLGGCPVAAGASVRRFLVEPPIADALPALERYSRGEPFFARLADEWLAKLEKQRRSPFGGHIVSPLIWAMIEAGVEAPPGPPPEWYVNHTQVYSRPPVLYALVGRRYQTGVVFRGRAGEDFSGFWRGMQTFALGAEPPVLFHTERRASSFEADGVNTAIDDVDRGPDGWEVFLQERPAAGGDPATIIARHRRLWTLYAFTPASAVVALGGAQGPIRARWAMNRRYLDGLPRLDPENRRVVFDRRAARVHWLAGTGSLATDEGASLLTVESAPPLNAFAFSDESFRFLGLAAGELSFVDASGTYRLSLKGVLNAEGNIDRTLGLRLERR